MKNGDAGEPERSLAGVISNEDDLNEAVTALRRGRGPRKGRSGKARPPSDSTIATAAEAILEGTGDTTLDGSAAEQSGWTSDAVDGLATSGTEENEAPVVQPIACGPTEPSGTSDIDSTSDLGGTSGLDPIDPRELVPILETLIFVSHDPLTTERAMAALGVSKADVIRSFQQLQQDYDREGRGLQVVELAGGFRIVTRPDYAPWLKRLEKIRPAPKLSRSALESLAIIAYKQPVVRGEIEQIRGVETSGVLRTLLERKLVRMVGRKEVPGRPIMYGTTKYFLEHFGLKDLSELPPLREFKELGESEQALLPVDDNLLNVSHDDAAGMDVAGGQPIEPEASSESEAMIAADPL